MEAGVADVAMPGDATSAVDGANDSAVDSAVDASVSDGCTATAFLKPSNGQYIVVGGGVPWANYDLGPKESDDFKATADLSYPDMAVTHFLAVGGFGFAVPADASVRGVEVIVERSASVAQTVIDNGMFLVQPGVGASTASRTAGGYWPTTDEKVSYGAFDDTWNLALAPSDVNNGSFAIHFGARVMNDAGVASVDSITARVHYCE